MEAQFCVAGRHDPFAAVDNGKHRVTEQPWHHATFSEGRDLPGTTRCEITCTSSGKAEPVGAEDLRRELFGSNRILDAID
jgi:hypothetical protein